MGQHHQISPTARDASVFFERLRASSEQIKRTVLELLLDSPEKDDPGLDITCDALSFLVGELLSSIEVVEAYRGGNTTCVIVTGDDEDDEENEEVHEEPEAPVQPKPRSRPKTKPKRRR